MPRRVQDIIPSNKRSIREIPVAKQIVRPVKREKKDEEEIVEIRKEKVEKAAIEATAVIEQKKSESKSIEHKIIETKDRAPRRKKRFPWALTTLGVVVVVALAAIPISGHFAKATFTLAPKILPVSISGTYIIPNISRLSATSTGSVGYELITLSGNASTTVPAVQGPHTETKAQGSITLYNSYSSQSQKIVAGTRMAGVSGLVYRLTSSVVVPGSTKSGLNVIPGSIAATIIAENSGAQYNISKADTISDLKIIAYKGTAKYSGFYGRLTSDVTGGFSGTQVVVAPSVLASSTAKLQISLVQNLIKNIESTIPAGYVTYTNAYSSILGKTSVTPIDAKTATLDISSTVYVVILNKINLAKFLAGASSSGMFGKGNVIAPDINSLSFVIANQSDFSPANKTNLIARINGSFNLVGEIPVEALKSAVSGISISKTGEILKKYASTIDILRSSAEINPPWVSTVPTDPNRIIINIKTL